MTNESKTLFIPLYGKARISREGFLRDEMAEKIVSEVDFDFGKVDQSRRLAIYMAMREMQFDRYVRKFAGKHPEGLILQLGVGLDSRASAGWNAAIPGMTWTSRRSLLCAATISRRMSAIA